MARILTPLPYSPELVAKLGQDYTVYAYDYSEYETPLVGQGMLSWVLASSSSTPLAPANQSRTMITGRVCKNILGLFSNGVKETLEVKLRLVPVPTCLQSEYLTSMDRYRQLSKVIPKDFDASAWTAFLQANPRFMQSENEEEVPGNGIGMEIVHQMLDQGTTPQSIAGSFESSTQSGRWGPVKHPANGSKPISRTASPTPSLQSAAALQQVIEHGPSRPSSATSTRKTSVSNKIQIAPTQGDAVNDAGCDASEGYEEGPARKRARVTSTDWRGKSTFGTNPESLRVAASTAASIRIHRPIAMQPSIAGPNSGQEPPRAPTPHPITSNEAHCLPRPSAGNGLRRESSARNYASYKSPYPPVQDVQKSIEPTITSPELVRTASTSNTPMDFASSPPNIDTVSPTRSSPVLPTLPRDPDSGFMSGSIDDLFEDEADTGMRQIKTEDLQIANRYSTQEAVPQSAALRITEVTPGPSELLPTKLLPRTFDNKRRRPIITGPVASVEIPPSREELPPFAHSQSLAQRVSEPPAQKHYAPGKPKQLIAPRPVPMSRANTYTVSKASLLLPRGPVSEPLEAPPRTMHRSSTWSGHQSDHATSEGPSPPSLVDSTTTTAKPRSGSGAKRKKAIQERLATSIAAGEMPPYCENCGAIETPTWRKAWTRIHSGAPDNIRLSDEDGGVIACEKLLEENGADADSYKIIKKSLLDGDAGFTEILLCNRKLFVVDFIYEEAASDCNSACGLWLNKAKCMRPPEIWKKEPRDPNEKRKRAPKRKKAKTNTTGDDQSEAGEVQASALAIDDTTPWNKRKELEQTTDLKEEEADLPPEKRPRASSVQHTNFMERANKLGDKTGSVAALQRAIQSSPARFLGTQHSPIDLDDLTPKPIRRLLFPSPRNGLEAKSLQATSTKPQTPLQKFTAGRDADSKPPAVDQSDKENCPPVEDEDGELAHLFEDDDLEDRPSTPSPSRQLPAIGLLRTPDRMTPSKLASTPKDIFSSAAKNLFLPPLTPLRISRSGGGGGVAEMTPFTAQLNQLLSEAHGSPLRLEGYDFLPTSNGRRSTGFDLPYFDPEDLLSTDIPMPSSPPAFFSLYEDPVLPSSGFWSDYVMPESPKEPLSDRDVERCADAEVASIRKRKVEGSEISIDVQGRGSHTVDFTALIDEVVGDTATGGTSSDAFTPTEA
ncbi:MAG: hypothetical protein M1827_001427 [Pycnora praestabilis]|nr:MAG: hypothetical protein M1827_001427 [Pycnora praestabilis]